MGNMYTNTDQYITWLSSNPLPGKHKRGSETTINNYKKDLQVFARWFNETTGLILGPESLTPDDIQDYISHMQTVLERKPNTILRHFASIRSYCLFLLQTDERIMRDLTMGVRLPKKSLPQKVGLNRLERNALKRAFTTPWKNTEKARQRLIRDEAITYTLMYVGLRLNELASVSLDDLHIGQRAGNDYLYIQDGKNNRARTAGVPPEAARPLRVWLDLRDELDVENGSLFVQIKKGNAPLGERSIGRIIEEAGNRAKMDKKITPHILRHTAVRIWRKRHGDRITAAQMGHSISTMLQYDAVTAEDVVKAAASGL